MIKYKLNKKIIIIAVGIILLATGASYAVYAAGVVFFGGASAQTVVNFTAVGTTSWTVPEGITSVEVLTVAGGGGGGAIGTTYGGAGLNNGAPGGGGAPNSWGNSPGGNAGANTDGGGWTLVLLNNKGLTSPTPIWSDAINSVNTTGSVNTNLTSYDLFLGVSYWRNLGAKMCLQIGPTPTSLTNKAIYSGFSFAGNYALTMSGETIVVGSGSPGMSTYHAASHFNLTTSDRDNDVNSGNC